MSSHPMPVGLHELRRNWGWFFVLGVCLIFLGMFAIGSSFIATIAGVVLFGCLLLGGGVIETISAIAGRQWSGFFLHLLIGVLDVVVGLYFVTHPAGAALTLTLLIAAFLIVGGLYRVITAASLQFPHWGWAAFSGLISVLLGVMIWKQWPISAFWFIGTCIGIDLVFRGVTWVSLALRVRSLPAA